MFLLILCFVVLPTINNPRSPRDEDFPDPPSPLIQSTDMTDSGSSLGSSSLGSGSSPGSISAASTVLGSAPEPWNPNESYMAPVVRSVRAPTRKAAGKSPSTEISR